MIDHRVACLLAACLLAAIPGTAQTAAEITGQTLTAAAATAGALTDGASAEEDVTTYAADFERDTLEYLSIADNPSLSTGDVDYAIAGWINLETAGVNFVLSKDDAVQREYYLGTSGGTLVSFFAFNGAGGIIGTDTGTTFGALSTGTWYFLYGYHCATNAGDCTANTVGVSVNAGVVDSSATSGAPGDTDDPVHLGARRPGAPIYTDGMLASVGFWKGGVPTAATLTAIFAAGPDLLYADLTAGEKTNLVSWWDHEEAEGAQRDDSHGANHSTDNNTVGQAEVVYP